MSNPDSKENLTDSLVNAALTWRVNEIVRNETGFRQSSSEVDYSLLCLRTAIDDYVEARAKQGDSFGDD